MGAAAPIHVPLRLDGQDTTSDVWVGRGVLNLDDPCCWSARGIEVKIVRGGKVISKTAKTADYVVRRLAVPQMNYAALFQGIRRRSWTSNFFDPTAEPWKLDFYHDSGSRKKVLGIFPKIDGWTGWRVVVTNADTGEQQWTDLNHPGAPTYLEDYLKGLGTSIPGNAGHVRRPEPKVYAMDYGYEAIFEELARAMEPCASPAQRKLFESRRLAPSTQLARYKSRHLKNAYDVPYGHAYLDPSKESERLGPSPTEALQLLDVDYHVTPFMEGPDLWKHKAIADYALFTIGGAVFVFGCLYLGIQEVGKRNPLPRDEEEAEVYARSKGTARVDGDTGVRLSDIGGIESQKQELLTVIDFLIDPDSYDALGARPPKGVLLEGPPGTGKTMLAKAIAGESGVPFFQVGGSEFVEMLVGVGAARVRDLFNRARINAPCLVFIDEVDSIAMRRGIDTGNTDEEREQALNQLLTELDGFTPDVGVVFVAATNRLSELDPAILRPGRFDLTIRIGKPETIAERIAVLKIHTRDAVLDDDVDMTQIARDLPGLSAAQLANLVREAKLACITRGSTVINRIDFYNAIDRVLLGVRSPPLTRDLPMRRGFAIYEASKAIFATIVHRRSRALERVERISIIARNGEFSRTAYERMDPRVYTYRTRGQIMERICHILAGRVGEYIFYGEASTLSSGDLSDATNLIRRFLTNYGLSRRYGIPYQREEYRRNPKSEGQKAQRFTGQTKALDDWEDEGEKEMKGPPSTNRGNVDWMNHTQSVYEWAYVRLTLLLLAHRDAIEKVADALLEKDELLVDEFEAIVDSSAKLTPEEVKQYLSDEVDKDFLARFLEWNHSLEHKIAQAGGGPPF